jgi:DNA-binding NarL/FixJ family response regulator
LKRIRIALADMRPMLREIVRDNVARQPDMAIVGDYDKQNEFLEAATEVDVAIIGARELSDSDFARHLLRASLAAKVLAIAANGHSAMLWELRPHQLLLGEVSPQALIQAIRETPRTSANESDAFENRS